MMMMREGARMMMIVGLQGSEGSLDDRCVVMLMRWFFSTWHLGFDFSQLHEHGAYSRKKLRRMHNMHKKLATGSR